MKSATEEYLLMGAGNMPMGCAEKPKPRLFTAVLPSIWFIKLRSKRRRSRALKAPDSNEPVIPDNAPFLPKTVQNCYKSTQGSEVCVFAPLEGAQAMTSVDPAMAVANAVPVSTTPSRKSIARSEGGTPSRKSIARSEGNTTRSTPLNSIATTTSSTSSIFSRCMYRSTFFSGLRNLCKLVDDDSLSPKERNSMQLRKPATPTMKAWFLVGCGGTPRSRTRHSSLDLEKEAGLMELDADAGLDCIDEGMGVEASWPKKAESWSGPNTTPWNVEANNEEVVKNQVVVKKKKYAKNREPKGVKLKSPVKLKPGAKPTLGHLFSTRSDTDSPRKVFAETEEESEIHIENPKLVTLPWRSMSFSSDSTFRVPSVGSEYGVTVSERRPFSFSDFEAPSYNEDRDNGNISDSQSLLRAKVLAAERMREGSKSWREVRKLEMKKKDEEAVKLLASLDQALDQRNLKRLIEDEEDSDPGYASMFGSPRFELHNSPVFESFLESSAKAWGIDFPSLKMDEARNSGSISDKSRELHCVTVQTATQMEKARELAMEREYRGRETIRAGRVNPASPATKARKAKRPVEKEVGKRPSPPSRKTPPKHGQPSPPLGSNAPKHTRDQRTIHPQREESMVDLELHDEFNHARKKFNEERKRTKQRRSKQVASVPDASPPPPALVPSPSPPASAPAAKQRVAVVVESSYDPYNDFRESMIEMIVDQDIQETGDLEELLQCYLSLNEAEYHNVIVDVFTDVWHELFENKF